MEHEVRLVAYYAHVLADIVIAASVALVAITVFFPVTMFAADREKRIVQGKRVSARPRPAGSTFSA
jgi:hypothetical protein